MLYNTECQGIGVPIYCYNFILLQQKWKNETWSKLKVIVHKSCDFSSLPHPLKLPSVQYKSKRKIECLCGSLDVYISCNNHTGRAPGSSIHLHIRLHIGIPNLTTHLSQQLKGRERRGRCRGELERSVLLVFCENCCWTCVRRKLSRLNI